MRNYLFEINCRLYTFVLVILSVVQMLHVNAFSGQSLQYGLKRKIHASATAISAFNNFAKGQNNKNRGIPAISNDRSYWERLNSPKFVMAPMVAQSDLPFRRLCRNHGTDLCFTQMIHASNFVSSGSFQDAQLDVYPIGGEVKLSPSGVNALKGLDQDVSYRDVSLNELLTQYSYSSNDDIDPFRWNQYREGLADHNPLIVQLAGHDVDVMAEAAMVILGE